MLRRRACVEAAARAGWCAPRLLSSLTLHWAGQGGRLGNSGLLAANHGLHVDVHDAAEVHARILDRGGGGRTEG